MIFREPAEAVGEHRELLCRGQRHAGPQPFLATTTRRTQGDRADTVEQQCPEQLGTIVDEVTADRNAAIAEVDAENRQAVLDAGATIRELSPEQREAWVEAMKPVWEQFTKDVGQENIDIAQEINAKH